MVMLLASLMAREFKKNTKIICFIGCDISTKLKKKYIFCGRFKYLWRWKTQTGRHDCIMPVFLFEISTVGTNIAFSYRNTVQIKNGVMRFKPTPTYGQRSVIDSRNRQRKIS